MKLVTVDQMRRIEAASDAQGQTYAQMMDLAGAAVARAVQERLAVRGKRVLVLVGPGNNGGDGLVAARDLKNAGAQIGIYLLKPRDDEHVAALREQNVFIANLPDDRGLRSLRLWLSNCDVIIDALLGTGVSRPLGGDLGKLLNAVSGEIKVRHSAIPDLIRPSQPPVVVRSPLIVAVDGPTGLNYDTGEIDPLALTADLSVTFAYPKIGHTRFPGAGACGELSVANIGTDPALASDVELELADPALLRSLLPARPPNAHKGTFGKTMIVAGSTLYTGAPILAAGAAYRAGAGLITLATPRSIQPIMSSKINEATFLPLPDQSGVLTADAADELNGNLATYAAALIGPGLTTNAKSFVERFLASGLNLPIVLDADALNCAAQIDQWWARLRERVPAAAILTPHPGEMSRLTGLSTVAVETDRLSMAVEHSKRWGHVVVLKGAFTVVAAPDGRSILMPFANPALATAGSGDVLAGTIVAMLSQGLEPYEAAVCGTYLHGAAGEFARREIGAAGVMAGDLLLRIPQALRQLS